MEDTTSRAIAIVATGAILPDAANVASFWKNVKDGRYSITEVAPSRWDPAVYYDPDPAVPDRTYSKIGGWVREWTWDPIGWRLPIPPRVAQEMDDGQKWAVACTREALEDYGYPKRPLDIERTAVILGNAMAGEKHYVSALRIYFPEYAHELEASPTFAALPAAIQRDIERELHDRIAKKIPAATEDTMPGELANCIAGRIANAFNFHGPNFVTDAACASAMAAVNAAADGLIHHDFDVAITGGIDRNMGVSSFVKFCKIGALSATGSRPYGEGADGFVMGEGASIFILKRLADAERDGDRIYAVLRGVGGASDGKGKGITAPNPVGQKLAVERAWINAGLDPATATLFEGHGTSTRVGDVVEVNSLIEVLNGGPGRNSIALGSVKSNIGHLKAAAGAAGLLKATLALRDKVLPPSLNAERRNPGIDFEQSPLFVNSQLRSWEVPNGKIRRAGVSAFGFGGTNFHMVLEEHVPGALHADGKRSISVSVPGTAFTESAKQPKSAGKPPLRGALVLGAETPKALADRLRSIAEHAKAGQAPAPVPPSASDLRARERLAIDYGDAAELAEKAAKALKALSVDQPAMWKALRSQGVFRGSGPAPKVAFLYTGQGSQYPNMLRGLRDAEPIVRDTFAEADRVMTPLLGKPLTGFVFVDATDKAALAKADDDLRQTAITQPAVLTLDESLTRLLAAYGIAPDMTMGHSLGEYGALVASGALPFEDALEAVSARGREMTRVSMADNGRMAAVFAPMAEIERILKAIDGYVVIANINSENQAVIGGESRAVEKAMDAFLNAGYNVVPLPVSHAFHTSIVAPASAPLRSVLERLRLTPPKTPIVANVSGEFYPKHPNARAEMLDILARQVASPVQFVKGLRTLYDAGARVFVEVGPKKALQGFAEDVLGAKGDVLPLFTNHHKLDDAVAFNQALCGLYAFGLGHGEDAPAEPATTTVAVAATATQRMGTPRPQMRANEPPPPPSTPQADNRYAELGRMFADVFERGMRMWSGDRPVPAAEPVVVTGAGLGLPGRHRIFDDENVARILHGEQLIDLIPTRVRQSMLDHHVRRLVKTDNGGPTFETIENIADVIKLAGRGGEFDIEKEFGIPAERAAALDRCTALAIAVGLEALRDAGIPLVLRHKTTSIGTRLPDRWGLPDAMRDDTGIVFASVFPGFDSFADETARFYADQARREQLAILEPLLAQLKDHWSSARQELEHRIGELHSALHHHPYSLDRKLIFRMLSMGHSQFAEYIGARGPNTQVNAACASTTQAVAVAEDWINTGRCRRVIIVSADDITTDNMIPWFGSAFLASGAAATDEIVENAALPFDRRRHGMITGMGAAAMVVESADATRERGIRPICEILGAVTANSAFHGTRLDLEHICGVMEGLIAGAEKKHGISRSDIAPRAMFMSHETYTPARGGSASAEINALRRVFGDLASSIVIANTKGFTGHAMGAGVEDVVAIKALETGVVPPVANFKEIDPELGPLNLSKGSAYPVDYAIRLGAGFGSQISMTLYRWIKTPTGVRPAPNALGFATRIADQATWDEWLAHMTGAPAPALEVVNRTLRVVNRERLGAAPPVVVAAQAPPPPAPRSDSDAVKDKVLALVAEKTGYPPDMLALDLDLEADLGVDTVKQAEIFATIREAYGIQRDDSVRLRDFPTLNHVIKFVHDRRPDLASVGSAVVSRDREGANEPATIKGRGLQQAEAPQPTRAEDPIQQRVLAIVAEKTGYPPEMLALDLDLEADLGIDTVKQAELFASVREIYDIPRDAELKLRDFPTLKHVIQFVHDRRPDLAVPFSAPAPEPPKGTEDPIQQRVLAIVAEKTGYPPEMLALDLDLEADLGIDTVKQAELFASVREIYDIPRDAELKLRDFPTLKHVIKFVHDRRPDLARVAAVVSRDREGANEPAIHDAQPVNRDREGAAQLTHGEYPIQQRVLGIVAEKTGYPPEMLDLDLDLEADLGIDTVKQAELFAAVREIYDIPRDAELKLRDFPTLKHVIQFVHDRRPDFAPTPSAVMSRDREGANEPAIHDAQPVNRDREGAAQPTPAEDPIQQRVLAIVAEKTGYPPEMLDLDLDLEADLGIDTVKQAELFASIREIYGIPRDAELKLRDFPTLRHVISFARDRQTSVSAHVTAAPAASETAARPAIRTFDAAAGIPRRIPTPVLRPPLDLCKQTAVALGPGSRVVIMPDQGGCAVALDADLRARGAEPLMLDAAGTAEQIAAIVENWKSEGPIQGVYWLPALDHGDSADWREALRIRAKLLYRVMRALYAHVSDTNTFLIAATRMGGHHGYEDAGALDAFGGAVSGFVKAYKRERLDALVKAIDFEPDQTPANIASILAAEALRDPGAVEIGYKRDSRWAIGLREQPIDPDAHGLTLDKDTVFVVTGAAGSIVSAITADLASASGGEFYLLDVAPAPDPNDADLRRFTADKDGLKRDIFGRLRERVDRPTPAMVERELAAIERKRAALDAIEAVEAAGGQAHYLEIDLTDAAQVAQAVDGIRTATGRIDVLLHAAGVERSHFLPDKEPKEFDLVFDVKTAGWFNLLNAIGDMPLGAAVVFSSVAGRFGNGGQTDYSAANDLLCKAVSNFRATRPSTRGLAIDWTAWAGIGMASRGSIPKMMEAAGIEMLPPDAGIPFIRRELATSAGLCEIVAARSLGILVREFDETGGLDPVAIKAANAGRPLVGSVALGLYGGLSVETTVDPRKQPFLYDHRIDDTAVLPGVMGLEAFAEAVLAVCPGWRVRAIENADFRAPFKFYRDEPRTIAVHASMWPDGDEIVAECSLVGSRVLAGQSAPETKTHFTARVVLMREALTAAAGATPGSVSDPVVASPEIYRTYFHGPAYQVVARAWSDNGGLTAEMQTGLPPECSPADLQTLCNPRWIELCFQSAGLWEILEHRRMGLPEHVDRISFHGINGAYYPEKVYCIVSPCDGDRGFDAEVVDSNGSRLLAVEGYRTVTVKENATLETQHHLATA